MKTVFDATWFFFTTRDPDTDQTFGFEERPFGLFENLAQLEDVIREIAQKARRDPLYGPGPGAPFAWCVRERGLSDGESPDDIVSRDGEAAKSIQLYDGDGTFVAREETGPYAGRHPDLIRFATGDIVQFKRDGRVFTGIVSGLPLTEGEWKAEPWRPWRNRADRRRAEKTKWISNRNFPGGTNATSTRLWRANGAAANWASTSFPD